MGTELLLLSASVVLGIVHILAEAASATAVRGLSYNLGNREEDTQPLKGVPARLAMALDNFKETFPLFAAAVLVAVASNHLNATSALGAELYFWGRLVYLPVYAAGVRGLRTLVWAVSMVGIVLVVAACFM